MPQRTASLLVAFATTACFASSEPPRPELSIAFPEAVDAGSVHDAVLSVSNPGPEDIDPLFVSFTWVGVGGAQDVPTPIVNLGARGENRSVLEVSPEPVGVSTDGTVYRFGSLPEGESMTITFTLRVPQESGVAANAVTVYDGGEIDRARGVRLQATVRR
ncbi:MAG: hypothetical protein ACRDJJ_06170 [Actinomycetota bacterium]